jgi:hypothetical protein
MPETAEQAGERARLAAECDRLAHRLNQHRAALAALLARCDEIDRDAERDAMHAYLETDEIRAFVDPSFRVEYVARLRRRADEVRQLGMTGYSRRFSRSANILAALDHGGTLTPAVGWKAISG